MCDERDDGRAGTPQRPPCQESGLRGTRAGNRPAPRDNPRTARLLLWLGHHRAKRLFRLLTIFLGGDMPCRDYGDLKLPHPYGVTIGDGTIIGRRCVIYQNVTVGTADDSPQYPILEDEVVIGANAVVIGPIRVGRGATVGAGAVVVKDVPPGATVVGNPGRVIHRP
jgi:serine acetyltransferase